MLSMLSNNRSCRSKSDWSDNTFFEIYFNKRKVQRIDPVCWKSHVISSLNDLYSNEDLNAYSNTSLLALILMLPHPTKAKLLFEDYIKDTGYNSDRPANSETLKITNISQSQHHRMFFCRVQNSLACDENLEALRPVLGVIALVCLRSTVKSTNVVKHFFSHELQSTMNLLYPNLDCIKELPLPTSAFFKKLPIICNKRLLQDMLILLVGMYTSEKKKDLQADKAILDILDHCILQAVRLNGLGIISLLEKISHIYQVDVQTVIELIYPIQPEAQSDSHESDNKPKYYYCTENPQIKLSFGKSNNMAKDEKKRETTVINEFYSKFMANDSLEFSWPRCRLIDDSYFYHCTIKDNKKSMILAAIVSLKEPGIWNMSAFKEKIPMHKERAMKEAVEYDKLLRKVLDKKVSIFVC